MTGAELPQARASARPDRRKGFQRAAGLALALCSGPLLAQAPVRITPSLSGQITFTDNVALSDRSEAQSDTIFELRPAVSIDYAAPRLKLNGTVAASIFLYARTGDVNNQVEPQVDLQGSAEVVKDFFFVEAAANVRQTFVDPFGARPVSLASATENRATAQTYRISPYVKGEIGSNLSYVVRDDNIWSTLAEQQDDQGKLYTNLLRGTIEREPTPLGWAFDVERNEYQFDDLSRAQRLELARVRGLWRAGPQLLAFVTGGYEQSRQPFANTDGAIYGVGFRWQPNERTQLAAQWERRFFGDSYLVDFSHRGPLTVWSLHAARSITSFPEQLAQLIPGINVFSLLNLQLASRIPDPLERARFILTFMQNRGLPPTISDPLALFVQQTYLQEEVRASYGILGARNSVLFSAYRTKAEPIGGEAAAIPPGFGGHNNNTQVGGGIIWTNSLTPTANLVVNADANRTEANPPFSGQSDQWSVRMLLTRPISPRTTATFGLRYQALDSDVQRGYREFAAFIGASYTYR